MIFQAAKPVPRRHLIDQILKKGTSMAKYNRNSGKQWTSSEVKQIRDLAKQNTPTRVIGLKLGRTEEAVRTRASQESISLKPTNQSPYNRRM